VQGCKFRVEHLECRVQCLGYGFGVRGLWFRDVRARSLGYRVCGLGFWV
jgi:hypothetical protein